MSDILLNIWITVFNPATFITVAFQLRKAVEPNEILHLLCEIGYMQSLSLASDLHNHNC